jgi:nickel transport protein
VCLLTVFAGDADAHKLLVFASPEGAQIKGSAYFARGGPLSGASVRILGPEGATLGQTTTDEKGEFSYTAEMRISHTVVVEAPGGHAARYVVDAEELPSELPAPSDVESGSESPKERTAAANVSSSAESGVEGNLSREEVRNLVEEVVSREVRPLRQDLRHYQEEIRFGDILGGIGYIVGVSGCVFYLLALRRRHEGS